MSGRHREPPRRPDRAGRNRSALPERAAEASPSDLARQQRDQRDLAIIEKHSERLNREASDALDYQQPW